MITPHLKSRIHEDVCALLEFDNHSRYYLLDCGVASDLTVGECGNLEAIFVTHTHIDHFSNFDQIMRHQIGVGRKIVLCGPTNIAQQVASKLQGFTWNLLEKGHEKNVVYEVREIRGEEDVEIFHLEAPDWEPVAQGSLGSSFIFKNEKFAVRYTLLDHGTPVVAYRFDEHPTVKINMKDCPHRPGPWVREVKMAFEAKDRAARIRIGEEIVPASELFTYLEEVPGASFGFIMDHAASPVNHAKIANLFANADEVWIEAFFTEIEKDLAVKNNHSTARASGEVCRRAQVKKAVPVHYSRRYHVESELAGLKAEFFAAFNPAD